jgi:uncharacterized protein YcaQ
MIHPPRQITYGANWNPERGGRGEGRTAGVTTIDITLGHLRHHAVARSLFPSSTIQDALDRLGFVQADPIRAPARAQDLTLRHRVPGYRAGDLERQYHALEVEEDFFVTYGFLPRPVQALMHPRKVRFPWPPGGPRRAERVLAFVRERGTVHPREVDQHFAHGTVRNYWGGSSSATTHLMEAMHYRGLLRVVRREKGIRIYAVRQPDDSVVDREARRPLDALVDVAVGKYAPLPAASLSNLISRLRYAVPQWQGQLRDALKRAKERLAHTRVDGTDWYWPASENPRDAGTEAQVRFLAPFDPVVWDRRRFELLWGWEYRFEAYTPARKRKLGYYALPLLWRDRVVGWANVALDAGRVVADVGHVSGRPPRDPSFRRELDAEIERLQAFLSS